MDNLLYYLYYKWHRWGSRRHSDKNVRYLIDRDWFFDDIRKWNFGQLEGARLRKHRG
jgi:hypothetical protein